MPVVINVCQYCMREEGLKRTGRGKKKKYNGEDPRSFSYNGEETGCRGAQPLALIIANI